MTKQKSDRFAQRFERLERKCDLILSELLIIRHNLANRQDIDEAIERMHNAAKRMRVQYERDSATAREKEIKSRCYER